VLEVNRSDMVKQPKRIQNSSKRGPEEYRFPCSIAPVSLVPLTTELKVVDNLGPSYAEGVPGYFILGSLKDIKESWWSEPPHIAFANLLAEDPKAAEAFTKRYGVLSQLYERIDDSDFRKFTIDSATFIAKQDDLRHAWPDKDGVEDIGALVGFEGEVEEGFDTDVVISGGYVHLRPRDLWASICFLYLWDSQAQRLGFCGNPDCPAPYFRKKRKTQKYCEQGPCVQHAQRQYSLDWWNRIGKKKREKRTRNQGKSK
jgi:hypothetical protein